MKSKFTIAFLLFISQIYCQVGINTTDPSETLHVNGTLRVTTTDQAGITTVVLGGMDADGVYREIVVGKNLTLENNVFKAKYDYEFGAISIGSITSSNNVDLLIGSGQTNYEKDIMRINASSSTNRTITGFVAGYDGQHVWIYPQSGQVELGINSTSSSVGNRIESNVQAFVLQYEMAHIVYDGTLSKWVIMEHSDEDGD